MISNWGGREPNNLHCIQSFDSVAHHLKLAILSRTFRITEHAQSSVVEYLTFLQFGRHKVMGIMLKKQVIY